MDLEIVSAVSQLDEPYLSLYCEGKISVAELQDAERRFNNVVKQIEIILQAVKPSA